MSATYQAVTPAPDSGAGITGQIRCLVYIGLPDNPQFLGPQDPQALAEKIMVSRGPSGENRDYLFQLHEALEGLSEESEDEHISDLARRCREIERRGQGPPEPVQGKDVVGSDLKNVGSTDEQEETEK